MARTDATTCEGRSSSLKGLKLVEAAVVQDAESLSVVLLHSANQIQTLKKRSTPTRFPQNVDPS